MILNVIGFRRPTLRNAKRSPNANSLKDKHLVTFQDYESSKISEISGLFGGFADVAIEDLSCCDAGKVEIVERLGGRELLCLPEPVFVDPEGFDLRIQRRLRNSELGGSSSGPGHPPFAFRKGSFDHFLLLGCQFF